MNEREQFERQQSYHKEDFKPFCAGLKAGAESKQAELDKANARIAQIEKSYRKARQSYNADGYFEYSYIEEALNTDVDIWLSEHDKAVEVKVLEEADMRCLNLPGSADTVMDCCEVLCLMIESRK